jgi:hypothetical protein
VEAEPLIFFIFVLVSLPKEFDFVEPEKLGPEGSFVFDCVYPKSVTWVTRCASGVCSRA